MQTRTFQAKTVNEAIQLVKREMGPDAVILSIRTVRANGGRLTGTKMLEVTAGTQQPDKAAPAEAKVEAKTPQREKKVGIDDLYRELNSIKQRLHVIEDNLEDHPVSERLDNMLSDFGEIQRAVGSILVEQDRKAAAEEMLFEGDLNELYRRLCLSGVAEEFARELMRQTDERLAQRNLSPSMYGMEYLAGLLMEQVNINTPFQPSREQSIHMLVGPTGVGKTTTVAKLAAQQVFEFNRSVALLTVDTFRIGAIDQLRTYARILDVPLEVCMNNAEMVDAVRRHVDKDVLFVDTAGSSQKDAGMIGELAKVYNSGVPMDVHLILSATTTEGDLVDITDRYSVMPLNSMIVSKLDEANSFGSVFNLMKQTDLPCSYFTVGQNVPDDIEQATPERVADLLLSISAQ